MPDDSFADRPAFGERGDPSLSRLAFGTMRLDRVGDVGSATHLVEEALDLGVTTFHVSVEYGAWPMFVEAWRGVSPTARANAQIIAKIGVPHFGEARFDPAAFVAKVDAYRAALVVERLDVVQWLLRHDLKQEPGRTAIFDRDACLIGETVRGLQRVGAIGALVSFPYTRGIAERALAVDWCDGLALYCNPLELEMADLFDRAAAAEKSVIAIRPFAAGRLFTETTLAAGDAIRLPLSHPAVVTVVASTSASARLRDAAAAALSAKPNLESWRSGLIEVRKSLHV